MNLKIFLLRSLAFVAAFFVAVNGLSQSVQNKTTFTITLDAGHGGHDPGALGSFSREKNITLAVIKKVGKRLADNNSDIKVVYTRDVDKYITLQGRADIANKAKSDLFLSVHVNANNNRAVSGCETYTLGLHKTQSNLDVAMRENSVILLEDNYSTKYAGFNPKSIDSYIMFECIQDRYVDKSVWLASEVEKNFNSRGRHDRGVRQAGFWVLHQTAMPAVLVEIGYITNVEEEKYLNSEDGQQNIADGIYDAIIRFKREYEIKSGNQKKYDEIIKASSVSSDSSSVKAEQQRKADEEEAAQKAIREKEKKESLAKSVAAAKEAKSKRQRELQESEIKAQKKEEEAKRKQTVKAVGNEIEYRLQLFALRKKLSSNDKAFKGLNVNMFEEDGLYKYTYGKTSDYDEIVRMKKSIDSKFPNAIIIGFRNGEKVSIREALKCQKRQ